MCRYKYGVVLATAWLFAGCASAPEDAGDDGQPTVAATVGVDAGGTASVATTGDAKTSPDLVVDVNQQPPTAYSEVICRQMLKPGSNVIVNVCGTRPEWKRYALAEARVAQDLLLRMQSGQFR